jgi:hypothetical protein
LAKLYQEFKNSDLVVLGVDVKEKKKIVGILSALLLLKNEKQVKAIRIKSKCKRIKNSFSAILQIIIYV